MRDARRVTDVLEGLRGHWEASLLSALDKGPVRSGELRRRVSVGLDYRVFHDTTIGLQRRSLIARSDSADGVSYELTEHGRAVLGLLGEIETWIDSHPEAAAQVPRSTSADRAGAA